MVSTLTLEDLEQFGNLELLAKQVVEGFITGLHKSPFHGFSVEFAEHRLYNNGESTRHIDWKLFAKTDKLFVKRYEEETNLRCEIIIDNSGSMYFPDKKWNKMKFSVLSAAAIMALLRKQRDAFGLSILDEEITFHSEKKTSHVHYISLLHQLELLIKKENHNKKTQLSENLSLLAAKMHRRSLIVLFSDMMQNISDKAKLYDALQQLRFNKHEIIIFHVQDAELETAFNFKNVPHLFIDAETGEKIKIQPADIKAVYLEKMRMFQLELAEKCAQMRIDLVEADANANFDQILTPFLIKRSRLY